MVEDDCLQDLKSNCQGFQKNLTIIVKGDTNFL